MIVYKKKKGVIISERVDKLPRKNVYLRNILDLDYEFRLRYILLDLDRKSYGQRFIIALIRHFPGVWIENNWTTNLDSNSFILLDLDFKILRLRIRILILIYLTGFGLESTWTRIWITTVRFEWIWTWKYLNCDLG